jgi:hypothetical protein
MYDNNLLWVFCDFPKSTCGVSIVSDSKIDLVGYMLNAYFKDYYNTSNECELLAFVPL